jgi:hypothetical protein
MDDLRTITSMNRNSYAKSITRLVDSAEKYYTVLPPYRILHRPEAVLAAKPELLELSKALESTSPVNAKAMDDLKELLSDGTKSPLFRKDGAAAKKAVADIRKELTTV